MNFHKNLSGPRRSSGRLALIGLGALALTLPVSAQVTIPEDCDPIANSYIVVLADGAKEEAEGARGSESEESSGGEGASAPVAVRAASLLQTYGGGSADSVYERAIHGFAASMTQAEAQNLSLDPEVAYVEQNCRVWMASDPQIQERQVTSWGLDRIDSREKDSDQTYEYAYTGQGVNVYVVDTGIRRTHMEFGTRVAAGHAIVGGDTDDDNGHGTHVAGTLAGSTVGIATGATIHPVRVFEENRDTTVEEIVAAVDWVTANAVRPAVVNMSLRTPNSNSLKTAVRTSIRTGLVYVVAAGNYEINADTESPANVPEAITVGAINQFDARAYFSNWGSRVDLFAPGKAIRSAWNEHDGDFQDLSGTSMASPHVAGVAALYLEKFPNATPTAVANAIISNATADVLINPSHPDDDPPFSGSPVGCGDPLVRDPDEDPDGGVVVDPGEFEFCDLTPPNQIVLGPGSPNLLLYSGFLHEVDHPPVADFTVYCDELTCFFDASASSDDNGIVSYDWNFGDGSSLYDTGPSISHVYASSGSYSVILTVTDGSGQADSQSLGAYPTDPRTCSITDFWVNSQGHLPLVFWSTTCPESGPVSVQVKTSTLSYTPPGCSVTDALWDGAKNGSRTADYMVGGYGASSQCPSVLSAAFWIELWEGSELIDSRPAQHGYYVPVTSACRITSFSVTQGSNGQTPTVAWSTTCSAAEAVSVEVLTTTISSTASGCAYDGHVWASGVNGSQNANYMAGGYGSGCGAVSHAVFWLEVRDSTNGNLLRRSNYFDAYYTP